MTEEQKYIIELSRAVIFDKAPSLPSANLDWNYIWNKALEQNISGLLASVILKLPKENQPANTQLWRNIVIKTTYLMSRKAAEFERMISILSAHKIQPVCLKGCMIRTLYPNPNLRIMGDFDIFIDKSEKSSVLQIFEEEGYRTESSKSMILASKDKIVWEVFTTLRAEFDTDAEYWDNCLRKHTYRNQAGYVRLEQTYDFAYTVLHAAKHFLVCGCGIRPLLDLALMLKNYDSIDFDAVEEMCGSHGASKVLDYIYNVVDKIYGIPVSAEYEDLDAELFLEYMLQYGIFGQRKGYIGHALDKDNTGSALEGLLFPNAKVLRGEYEYLEKYPILLPVAWVERIATIVFVRKNTFRDIIMSIKASSGAKRERDYWIERLGL